MGVHALKAFNANACVCVWERERVWLNEGQCLCVFVYEYVVCIMLRLIVSKKTMCFIQWKYLFRTVSTFTVHNVRLMTFSVPISFSVHFSFIWMKWMEKRFFFPLFASILCSFFVTHLHINWLRGYLHTLTMKSGAIIYITQYGIIMVRSLFFRFWSILFSEVEHHFVKK